MKADPLKRAGAVQRRAARQGFDWPPGDPRVWRKLFEEIAELKAVARKPRQARAELGDLLFMVVNLSRHLKVDAGGALRDAIRKFEWRYGYVMKHSRSLPRKGDRRRLDAMERLWREAKQLEKGDSPLFQKKKPKKGTVP